MKKYLLLPLLAAILTLGACSNKDEFTNANKETDVKTESQSTETKDTPATDENEEAAEVKTFDIKFNAESKTVELIHVDGTTEVLADKSASEPLKSPDGKKTVYISPFDWEELGNVYLVNLEDGSQDVLVAPEGEYTPKNIIWEDDEHVLVIIGYAYGTVDTGGNIYRVNLETKEKNAITEYEADTQITDFNIENGILHFSGIKYTDDMMNEHEDFSDEIALNSLSK